MKVVRSLLLLAAVALMIGLSFNSASANTYASDVRIVFSGNFNTGPAQINFVLNDSAVTVVVRLKQGATVVRTINAGAKRRGANTVNWDGKNDAGANAPAGAYSVEITTTGPNYTAWTQVFDSGGIGIFTRGVDINRDPTKRDFGFIYASNNGGATNPRGLWRFRGDGAAAGDTALFAVGRYTLKSTLTTWTGSTAAQRVFFATLDWRGWVWTTDPDSGERNDPRNAAIRVFKPGDGSTTQVIRNVRWAHGLAAVGTDANFKLYVAANTFVLRYNLGANLTAVAADTIAKLGVLVRDVLIDDSGFMYVNLRAGTTRDGTAGGGIATEKYNISGTLPVTRANALWSVAWTGSRPIGLAINSGANKTSNTDDKLYVSVAEGTGFGVQEISGISGTTPTTARIFTPPLGDISQRADLTVDVAGNVILFENNNEHVYFVAPPGNASYTTPAIDPVNVTTPLPVELASFTVSVVNNGVELNWATASETNNYGFEVQRGADEKNFQRVGFVAGNGTTTAQHAYKFADRDLAAGTYYYRLKQIDTDGTITFSEIVRADLANVVREYALQQNYPNPFNPTTTIAFALKEDGFVKLRLFNMLGQQVVELVNGQLKAGAHTAILDARNLSSGTYLYILEVNGFRAQKRLQIIK